MNWLLLGSTVGQTPINLPESFKELLVIVKVGGSDYRSLTHHILYQMISSECRFLCGAVGQNGASIVIKNGQLYIEQADWGSTSGILETTITTIYYK